MDAESETNVQVIEAEYDDEGVYFYQAFNDEIADWTLEHQVLGGPFYNPTRMTWIKPSFAWVLYRSGYARKHNQTRILKIKLSHESASGIYINKVIVRLSVTFFTVKEPINASLK